MIDTCSEESISVLPARTCAINLFIETENLPCTDPGGISLSVGIT